MINNNLSDMISRILNAQKLFYKYVYIYFSKINFNILKILKIKGYIINFFILFYNRKKFIILKLKYKFNEPVIKIFKKISSSNYKFYLNFKKLYKILNNLGLLIITTSKGIMTGEDAKKIGIGGKLICYVF